MEPLTRRTKLTGSVAFLLIAIAALVVHTRTVRGGPWDGIHVAFWPAWLAIIAAALLLIASDSSWIRVLGAMLLAMVIGAMTLQWGTLFGIRDPWIHLVRMRDEVWFGSNPYPLFHSFVDGLALFLGIPRADLLPVVPLIALPGGVLCIAALASRLASSVKYGALAGIVFLPVAFVDVAERPIAFSAVILLPILIIVLASFGHRAKSLLIILYGSVLYLWHPLNSIMFMAIATGAFVILALRRGLSKLELPRSVRTDSFRYLARPQMLVTFGIVFVILTVFVTTFGGHLVGGLLLQLFVDPDPSAVAAGSEGAILPRVLDHLSEALIRASIVIMTGSLALAGWVLAPDNSRDRVLAAASVVATGGFVFLFVAIDFAPGIEFAATRAVPLAPLVLLVGALVGHQELRKRNRRAATFVGVIVLIVGLAVVYPAPWTGTHQSASTMGDVHRTDWLVTHEGLVPVYDAQNTYVIADARYGAEAAQRLANGDRWSHERNTRANLYPWEVEPDGDSLVVVHQISRLRARALPDGEAELAAFEARHSKVYVSQSSTVYFVESD